MVKIYSSKQGSQAQKSAFFQKSLGFRSRFLMGTAMVLLLICIAGAYFMYQREKRQLEEHAYDKTRLVMMAVEATRKYVREDLRPEMFREFGSEYFMVQAMSTSYVGRAVMDNFNEVLPDYEYRRVAKNARNPDSEANNLELSMINHFRKNPDQQNWQGVLEKRGQKQFMRFKTVYFQESCMSCHGDPADAPGELIQLYGSKKGFGNQPGDLAGVIAVGIPVQSTLAEIRDNAIYMFIVLFAGASLFYLLLAFIFNWVVVNNLRGVLNIFRGEVEEKSLQDFIPEPDAAGERDELQELTEAAVIMSKHLRSTKHELKEYAQNLEQKVAQRTEALQESERLLQQKILARNQELQTLNSLAELTTKAVGLSEILPQVLHRTLQIFPARGAGIYLYDENQNQLLLQYQENALGLVSAVSFSKYEDSMSPVYAKNLADSIVQAACGQMSYFECKQNAGCLNIPLYCRGRVLGVMTFTGVDEDEISSELHSLLASIGRQIGIAVESLQNMEKLMQSKELLQSVFDGITDQVVLMDRDFRIRMVNKAYTRIYNVEMDEVLGRRCFEIHGSGERPCQECGLNEAMQTKVPVVHETRCPSLEGIFQVHCYPTLDESGEVERVIRYVKEVTDQKQMEQKIQQTEKLVAMGQLAAGVAHEINNPLGVILCYVELLNQQLSETPQGQQDLGTIEKQARNCKRIVSDLLEFARSGETSKHTASLNQTLEEVLGMVGEQFKKQGVQIEVDLDHDLPQMEMDTNKIKQVFMNLLMNARQAMDGRDGKMHISTRYSEQESVARVVFWDNGKGIPEYMQDKIFDPFFSTKHTGEGTGLGLSVSYGIVREHGGDIKVESRPGEWTRFIIDLPI